MRGSDKGGDFDRQWNESARRGREKADKGQGAWAEDKYLKRINAKPRPAHHAKKREGCADKTVALLALLGGLVWALTEAIGRAH